MKTCDYCGKDVKDKNGRVYLFEAMFGFLCFTCRPDDEKDQTFKELLE